MTKLVLCFLLMGFSFIGYAQDSVHLTKCAQQIKSDSLLAQYPEMVTIKNGIRQEVALWSKMQQENPQVQSVISIPVVFHVLYRNDSQNISTAQIQAQLDALNRDFRRNNPDTIITPHRFKKASADTEIEFCFAAQDPDGQPTNGIIRKETHVSNIGNTKKYYEPLQGGSQIWNPNEYLNIWVCDINDSLLGFTFLPGEATSDFDGVVIHYKVCGDALFIPKPYHRGRSLVHEIGHWLGLQHPWGPKESCDYDDDITDTPRQEKPNTGCPNGIIISCDNGPDGDMWVNYMDYTYDDCQSVFTHGQKEHMHALLNTHRKGLLSTKGCIAPDTSLPFIDVVDVFPNPTQDFLNIRFNLHGPQTASISIFDITGKAMFYTDRLVNKSREIIDVSQLPIGTYLIIIKTNDLNMNFKFVKTS